MSALKVILITLASIVGVIVAIPAGYYLTDGPVEAFVVKRPDCGGLLNNQDGKVTVETTIPVPGIRQVVEVPKDKCHLISKDNYVRHTLRSERTSIWTKDPSDGGSCIWDTENGPTGCNN